MRSIREHSKTVHFLVKGAKGKKIMVRDYYQIEWVDRGVSAGRC